MKFTQFDEVVSYMEEYMNLEKKTDKYNVRTYRLDRMAAILERLGNPQNSYKTIHVAGSKGKGSTASYIAHGLKSAGFKTGLYMSPHVTDYRERFTICGEFADDGDLVSTGNELRDKLEGFSFGENFGDSNITTFELYTAFAFLLFRNVGCQWAVIETGLGGRLDATNVITPCASVLTPIELEHTEILGNSIELIATEKSKIIKEGIPAFVSMQKPQAYEVFEKEACAKHAGLFSLQDNIKSLETRLTENGQYMRVEYSDSFCCELNLAMPGKVQAYNCALAILVLRKLGLYGDNTLQALERTVLPARMEKTRYKGKTMFIDGAHTCESIRNLISSYREICNSKDGVCIFGCVAGKRADEMADTVLQNFSKIVISRPGTYKKSNIDELYSIFVSKAGSEHIIKLIPEAKDALDWAAENTENNSAILCCGSFYLAGTVKEAML